MDYLRGNATASAVGLFVVCRYLSAFGQGRTEEELRQALQVLRGAERSSDDSGSVLSASLAIGQGVGVIFRGGGTDAWQLHSEFAEGLESHRDQWPWFRGQLLYHMIQQGIRQLESEQKAPDLMLGLTWLLQQNPLNPLQWAWGAGPEQLLDSLNFEAVSRSEQWRPFQRWAIALGLARRSDQAHARVLISDASTAISDQLAFLPAVASAAEWLAALRSRLPILGAQVLLDQLPKRGVDWDDVPPGVVLGLLKLEMAGVLLLEPSDDSSDVISLELGMTLRQVGRISVRSN